MSRAALVALLAAFASASPAAAAARDIPFAPLVAPAMGTCPAGDAAAYDVELAVSANERAALSPCVGTASPAGALLLVTAPLLPQAGTTLEVVSVTLRGQAGSRRLRIAVRTTPAPADGLAAQVLTAPRAAVRLGRSDVPRAWTLVDETGRVIARGRA